MIILIHEVNKVNLTLSYPVYLVYLTSLYFVEFVVQFVFVDIAGHSLKFIQIPSNVWLEEWVLYLTTAQLPET